MILQSRHPTIDTRQPRRGYVLIAVLVVIVVLSLVAYRFTDAMTSDYRAGVRTADMAQARAAAASGIHYVAAVLADPDDVRATSSSNLLNNPTLFQGIAVRSDSSKPKKRRLLLGRRLRQLRRLRQAALRHHR